MNTSFIGTHLGLLIGFICGYWFGKDKTPFWIGILVWVIGSLLNYHFLWEGF